MTEQRPEFRNYVPTKKQMAQWLNSMAKLYNWIHRNDPEWLHPMKEDYDESGVVEKQSE